MHKPKLSYTPSIRRLPSYLVIVRQARDNGLAFISGTTIAQELDLEPIQVRKDLALTGISGRPKKGYLVAELIESIERYLGWNRAHKAVVVGAGNLGSALSGYRGFKVNGLEVVAAFDNNPDKIGSTVHGVPVLPMDAIASFVRSNEVETAILTVPADSAQAAADRLVEGGIRAVWNFTNCKLNLPREVVVHREDLSSGYALLSVMSRLWR